MTSFYQGLTISSVFGNTVATNALNGNVSNSIDQTSQTSNYVKTNNYSTIDTNGVVNFNHATVTLTNTNIDFTSATITNFPTSGLGSWTANIAQLNGNTAQLGSTTWNASSVINALGATPENFVLTGANNNSVDNSALPTTLTQNVSNSSTTTTTLQRGTAGVGGLTTVISKNYTLTTSNTGATISTITGLSNIASDKWKIDILIEGATSGTTTGEASSSRFTVFKAGIASAWKVFTQPSYSSDTTKIGLTTLTFNATSGSVTLTQPSTTTNDGATHYNVECTFSPLNSASISAPTLS